MAQVDGIRCEEDPAYVDCKLPTKWWAMRGSNPQPSRCKREKKVLKTLDKVL